MIGILSWLWIIWVIASLINTKERLDKIEKAQGIIMEWMLIKEKASNSSEKAPMETDTNKNKPYGNLDGWKGLKGLNI